MSTRESADTEGILDLRDRFDLGDRAYLDGANHGPMPRRSLRAAREALEWKRDPALLDDRLYFELPDRVRRAAGALIGCAPRQVAIATGASHGISLVACGLDWREGDRVLVPTGEFPANALPWLALREQGVIVEQLEPERLLEAIDDRTRVVSVGHVNFATGRRLPLEELGEVCAARGTCFVVDVAQSLGTVPFDATACRATVVAAAGYKWLMSPYGTGLTYVDPDWVERFRLPQFNWATVEGAEDFNQLLELEPRHRPGAVRFDVPEAAAFVHGAAMAESLELLGEVGIDRVFRHSCRLIDRVVEGLPPGFRVDSPLEEGSRSTILRLRGPDPEVTRAAYRRARHDGVAVSLREEGIRIAPGIWSGPEDVRRLLRSLAGPR